MIALNLFFAYINFYNACRNELRTWLRAAALFAGVINMFGAWHLLTGH